MQTPGKKILRESGYSSSTVDFGCPTNKNHIDGQTLDLLKTTHTATRKPITLPTVKTGAAKTPFWKSLPQLINRLWFTISQEPDDDCLDYDPFNLRIFTHQRYSEFGGQAYADSLKHDRHILQRLSSKEMDFETFKLVLDQVPGVKTIEFSGRGEPLINPDLFNMITYAQQFNGAETTVVSNGHLLQKYSSMLLNSPLSTLCITLHAHKPSVYHQMSGLDAHNFVPTVENIKALVKKKKAFNSPLQILVSMTVDIHNFSSAPEMIAFAYELGVDGVLINNYLSPNPEMASERTLYSDQDVVVEFFDAVKTKLSHLNNFQVTLPTLLDRDMSTYRNCQEAYTTVAVDGNCSVSPCSRQLLDFGHTTQIWEANFWNHDSYQWLRGIHGNQSTGRKTEPVPTACQNCPKNLP